MHKMPRLKQKSLSTLQAIQHCEEQLVQAESDVMVWICSDIEKECPHSDTLALRERLQKLYSKLKQPHR